MAARVGHADKFRSCGFGCISDIYEYFKADFELFGIPRPTEPGAGGTGT
jgi:hypothetical protein